MIMKQIFRTLGLVTIFSVSATSFASAYIEPSDLPTCYLSIHDQCYGGGETNCTEEDYNGALDECDQMYGKAEIFIGGNKLFKAIQKKRGGMSLKTR